MPDRNDHLTRAKQNEILASKLNADIGVSVDWAVTMIFYAALHYVDAFLAGKNLHPLNHKQRDEEIEKNGSLSSIYPDYRRLKDFSRAARYDIPNFSKDKIAVAQTKLNNIKVSLGFIL